MNATLTLATALALTLVAGLPATLLAAPAAAAAAPTTATAHTDIDDVDGDLEPDPKVFIEASATCEPGAGITYTITTHHSPDNATGIQMQWMDENGAIAQNLAENDTVPSGEGVFDAPGHRDAHRSSPQRARPRGRPDDRRTHRDRMRHHRGGDGAVATAEAHATSAGCRGVSRDGLEGWRGDPWRNER